MEHSAERKLQLWGETSRANRMQAKAEGKRVAQGLLPLFGVIGTVIAFATILANRAG